MDGNDQGYTLDGDVLAALQDALFFAFPVTVFFSGAFVELFFATAEADFQFCATTQPVHAQRDESVASAFYSADQLVQFASVQQQATGARLLRMDMG